ncbi:Isochorismatase-like protein [Elsinoe ampelina]|uniref:Isochorismatase-like protein n=1 Tax=Elsinoe ampelina TaxID=302913 RepID=A0A6A6GHL3_9PEZI|nr:Isochorismatase-like protein [Elsinoe ampelina]
MPPASLIGSPSNFHILHANYIDLTRSHPSPPPPTSILLPTRTHGVQFDPAKTALVIIDMQNFFLSPALGRTQGAGHAAAKKLEEFTIPAARKTGVRVVWLNWGLTEEDLETMPPNVKRAFGDGGREVEIEAQFEEGLGDAAGSGKDKKVYRGMGTEMGTVEADGEKVDAGRMLMRDQWNAALYPPLDRMWEEGKGLSNLPDGGPGVFEEFLEKEGIKTLLFTGVNTDQCVAGTLTDAYNKGYDCIMLADGCGTTSPSCAQEGIEYNAGRSWGFVTDCEAFAKAAGKSSS